MIKQTLGAGVALAVGVVLGGATLAGAQDPAPVPTCQTTSTGQYSTTCQGHGGATVHRLDDQARHEHAHHLRAAAQAHDHAGQQAQPAHNAQRHQSGDHDGHAGQHHAGQHH